MKNTFHIPFLVAAIIWLIGNFPAAGSETAQDFARYVTGAETNGIRVDGLLEKRNHGWDYYISVFVFKTRTNYQSLNESRKFSQYFGEREFLAGSVKTNQVRPKYIGNGFYFEALNSFCGIVELLNETGESVPMRKPEVNLVNDYPASFSSETLEESRFWPERSQQITGKTLWPNPLIGNPAQLPGFSLTNLFALTEPGEYRLIISPIIYRRVIGEDLCVRVDLPKVFAPIKWGKLRQDQHRPRDE